MSGIENKTRACWRNMKRRCENPNHPSYHNYGERGINICNRWKKFENFLADMGEKPKGLSIERINNNKDYEPENCKWETWANQQRNHRARGYTWRKDLKKYEAQIHRNEKKYYLGLYDMAEEASEKYWKVRNLLNCWQKHLPKIVEGQLEVTNYNL